MPTRKIIPLNGSWNYIPFGYTFIVNVIITLLIEIGFVLCVYSILDKKEYSHEAKEAFLILAVLISNAITAFVGWGLINAI